MKKAFIITVSLLAVVVMVLGVYLFQTNTVLGNTSANLENLSIPFSTPKKTTIAVKARKINIKTIGATGEVINEVK